MKSVNKNLRSSGCSRPVCFARLVYIPSDSCNKTLTQKAQKPETDDNVTPLL